MEEEEEEEKRNRDLQEEQSSGRNILFFGVQLFEEKNLPNLECLSWRIQASFPAKTSEVTLHLRQFLKRHTSTNRRSDRRRKK